MDNQGKLKLIRVESQPLSGARARVTLTTARGDIETIFHPATGASGVVWVCGSRGGLDGPSFGIFDTLSQQLIYQGLSSLRLDYRLPGDFNQCVLDVLVGVDFLQQKGVDKVALVGHSFGGAVVIMAGTMSHQVKAVVGLASQTFGAHRVHELSPRPLLLIHGERDRNLPARCSEDIYQWAREPKELVIYQGCGHFLRECHQELADRLKGWLVDKLGYFPAAKS
ncbi:MAG: alpha/beta fold hydrolase [Chloroflexi bacterium]|nr:alpha/beta fold hydrolase [Chloroflexota bacterium]